MRVGVCWVAWKTNSYRTPARKSWISQLPPKETQSHSLKAVEAIRLSLADLHPEFGGLYQKYLKDLSHNFEQSREKANSRIQRLGSLIYVQSDEKKP